MYERSLTDWLGEGYAKGDAVVALTGICAVGECLHVGRDDEASWLVSDDGVECRCSRRLGDLLEFAYGRRISARSVASIMSARRNAVS